jgi:acetylornithine deacetylase/succinyl-diaminopimelate desuccinylase-like protein
MTSTYLDLARNLISFRTVSTDPAFQKDLLSLVSWLSQEFESHSFSVEHLTHKLINPTILATYSKNPSLPTILIYGHYDTQPAQISDGWDSDPFSLVEKNGRLYGRGIVDNKGQTAIHIASVFDLIAEGNLKYNIKFLLEGNEETGNDVLPEVLQQHKAKLAADHVIVSDGEAYASNPTLEVSLRGGFNATLKYQTANTNVHSGIYGGAIPNAAHELSKLLSKIYDPNNSVSIPGFYDSVDPITPEQLSSNSQKDSSHLLNNISSESLLCEPTYDFFTQTGLRPTIQVTGIKSGYIDPGYANIVPANAEARSLASTTL